MSPCAWRGTSAARCCSGILCGLLLTRLLTAVQPPAAFLLAARSGSPAAQGWHRRAGCRPTATARGVLPEEAELNAAIYELARAGDAEGAVARLEAALDEGAALDPVAYNAVAGALAQAGRAESASKWIRRMADEGLQPDEVSYATVIEALAPNDPRSAAEWLQEMLDVGFTPEEVTYAAVIDGLSRRGDDEAAAVWRQRMAGDAGADDEGDRPWANTFVDMLSAPDLWSGRPGAPGGRPGAPARGPRKLEPSTAESKSTSFGDAIVRCAKRGDPMRATVWLEKMLDTGFTPSAQCYVAIIEGFLGLGDVAKAAHWLDRMEQAGLPIERSTFHQVMDGYAAMGDTAGAVAVLERMAGGRSSPDVKAYNAMIRSCMEGGTDPEEAERWFEKMVEEGIAPDVDSYSAVVLSFARQGDQASSGEWLERTFAAGLQPSAGFMNKVAQALGRAAAQAERWLEEGGAAPFRANGALYTTLVSRRAKQSEGAKDATNLLEKISAAGLKPDQGAYAAVVDAWVRQGDVETASVWLGNMLQAGFTPSTAKCTAILEQLAEAGATAVAGQLLEQVASVDPKLIAAPVSTLVDACARRGDIEETLRYLQWMSDKGLLMGPTYSAAVLHLVGRGDTRGAAALLEQVSDPDDAPDLRAYNAVISGYAKRGDAENAVLWFTRMSSMEVAPDVASCASVVDAWAKRGDVQQAANWLEKFSSSGLALDTFSYTSIIDAFARRGDLGSAAAWLQRIVDAGIRTDEAAYNAVIKGWAKKGDAKNAARWLERMRADGLTPNAISYTTIIDACSQSGDTLQAVKWHDKMREAGVSPNIRSYNALIGSYAKQSNTAGASTWLAKMMEAGVQPDMVSYNSVIDSCARRGDASGASTWFERLCNAGLRPDEVSYNSLINSCAKAHDYKRASEWMDRMREAGLRPSVVTWSSLLLACADNGAKGRQKAEEAFAQMVREGVLPDRYTLAALDRVLGRQRSKQLCEILLGADGARAAAERAGVPRARGAA